LTPWGNFSIDQLKRLEEAGISYQVFCYSQTRKFDQEWKENIQLKRSAFRADNYILLLSCVKGDENGNIQAEEISIPSKSSLRLKRKGKDSKGD
jgi:hypothetical protein